MATYRRDPRMEAKRLADQMRAARMRTGAPEPEPELLDGLLSVSRCTCARVARGRVRELMAKASDHAVDKSQWAVMYCLWLGDDGFESLLSKVVTEESARSESCCICGKVAVRYLRKSPYPAVCKRHSQTQPRLHDLRIIRVCLLDPPPEFFEALVRYESSISLVALDDETDPVAMAPVWRRRVARPLAAQDAGSTEVLALWRTCCDPYPSSSRDCEFEPPLQPLTSRLWGWVSDWARARDAEASIRNGQQAGGRPRDKRQEKEVVRLVKRGISQKAIAARLGTSRCQVSRVLRRLRVP